MFGLLNLAKPIGLTSRDAVNRVQWLIRPEKVGHAGTLDPLARGVLVLCIGPAVRLIEYVQRQPKRYVATFRFGVRSDTDDLEGTVVPIPGELPTRDSIADVLPEFVGRIQQRPPAHSAVHIDGRRAYELARRGEAVELPPREVVVMSIELLDYAPPDATFDIRCGSGTYIRSIGRDLGERLGTAAVMIDLERTEIGPFHLGDAISIDALTDREDVVRALRPPAEAASYLPQAVIDERAVDDLHHGRFLDLPIDSPHDEAVAVDDSGRLLAILQRRRNGQWKALRNFTHVEPGRLNEGRTPNAVEPDARE